MFAGNINGFQEVSIHEDVIPRISRYLDTVGDGSGTKNAVGNYSGGVVGFRITPPSDRIYFITRILVTIRDTGSMDSAKYGNNITLTNGITVTRKNAGGLVLDLLDGIPVKTNGDWARACHDVKVIGFGSGDEYLSVRWSFFRAGNIGVHLNGADDEFFEVELNDNFTNLIEHYFFVEGHEIAL